MSERDRVETAESTTVIDFVVNGERHRVRTMDRQLLADTLRNDLGLTGSHLGCEHGVCGACTVLIDGVAARSCLVFTPQVADREVSTVEGLSDTVPCAIQVHFEAEGAYQCGFCTPGFMMIAEALKRSRSHLSEEEVEDAVSSNLCRCTGYQSIRSAFLKALDEEGVRIERTERVPDTPSGG